MENSKRTSCTVNTTTATEDDALFRKRCAFGSRLLNGRLDIAIIRGSTNDVVIQCVLEEFFDVLFRTESSVEATAIQQTEKELKDYAVLGWAGGPSILRVQVEAKGVDYLLAALEEEWSNLAYRLARKLDLSMPYNPDRTFRFTY